VSDTNKKIALVLSGGGSRAAYHVGSLKALVNHSDLQYKDISVIAGTSIGAVNSLILGAGAHGSLSDVVNLLEEIWRNRTYRTTFTGHMSKAFLRAIQVAMLRYRSPSPVATTKAIFDPTPLREEVDRAIASLGGIHKDKLGGGLNAVAVMTTLEGVKRKAMLLATCKNDPTEEDLQGSNFELLSLPSLNASHGFASAALPSVLPAVDLNIDKREVRLVDGGICDNVPVDPALRLGAESSILFDCSGRRWWFDHYKEPHDTKPTWEVPASETSFCMVPTKSLDCVNIKPFGPLLKEAVGRSTSDFIDALGPTWPIFRILKYKMGEELAYEVLSYTALHQSYVEALIERGYNETKELLFSLNEDKLKKIPVALKS
jgi:predicted acylesterase/phospholipase RssA